RRKERERSRGALAHVARAVRPIHPHRSRAQVRAGHGTQHPPRRVITLARNTHVAADTAAPPITSILANFIANHRSRGWSDAVDHEAHRTFYNWLGCAIGAARHEAADAAVAAVQMLEPAPQATVLGRGEKVDMASAALVNGITSHTFDFDDTHLKTIIHPAGPVASAVLALAEKNGSGGRD